MIPTGLPTPRRKDAERGTPDEPEGPDPDSDARATGRLATILPLTETLLKVFLATALVARLFGIGTDTADIAA